MEKYNGKLISADFEESTMEFEIQHEFTVKKGDYVILHKSDYDKLVSGDNSEPATCAIFDVSKMLPDDEEINAKFNTRKINCITLEDELSIAVNRTKQEGAKWMKSEIKKRIEGNFCYR